MRLRLTPPSGQCANSPTHTSSYRNRREAKTPLKLEQFRGVHVQYFVITAGKVLVCLWPLNMLQQEHPLTLNQYFLVNMCKGWKYTVKFIPA